MLFLIFLFGLIFGSFLNAVLYRLEVGGSLIKERSRCPKCGHILRWYELFPILSFMVQVGKCRECKKRISLQYPLVELTTGLLFLAVFLKYQGPVLMLVFDIGWLDVLYGFIVVSFLVLIFVFDLKHYIIPNVAVYSLILISFGYDLYNYDFILLKYYFLASVIAFGFFLFLYLVSSGKWIGFGDVKYGIFMGLFLGWPEILVGLFVAYVSGALIGSLLLAIKRKKFKSEIPFGPFLIFGTLVAFFWGDEILRWYLAFMI
jgi:prepilin signal peptidase PulO-like enzyme (type II secretory pathway)